MILSRIRPVLVLSALAATLMGASATAADGAPPRTRIVLLGTGTPGADPDRSGPATAIIVDDTPYLIDFGPGVMRRAAAAATQGAPALHPSNFRVVFTTHLHSDHTVGYPDLISTSWIAGRIAPLEVYGPAGIKDMTSHLLAAYRVDIDIRMRDRGLRSVQLVNAHEIAPGVIYRDDKVTVKAFRVPHGEMEAYGYRFETPDRVVVISGDTGPSDAVVENCNGCHVLIHEHYSLASLARVEPRWQAYRRAHHTSTEQLAEIASRARPGLLILYHRSNAGARGAPAPESEVTDEMQRFYRGRWVNGRDLEVY